MNNVKFKESSGLRGIKRKLFYELLYRTTLKGRKNILEIGCGTGDFLKFMIKKGANIKAIDNDKNLVLYLKKEGLPAEYADLFTYSNKNKYDAVYTSNVLEHLNDNFKAMKKIHDLLKPNGVAVILVPGFSKKFYDEPTHVRPYTKISMKRLLSRTGFYPFRVIELFNTIIGFGKKIKTNKKISSYWIIDEEMYEKQF